MDQSPGENEKEMKRWRCPDMRQKAEGIEALGGHKSSPGKGTSGRRS